MATRPDLSAAVGVLSEFMSNPGPEHWIGVKRILCYVKGTINYGLNLTLQMQMMLSFKVTQMRTGQETLLAENRPQGIYFS